MLGPLPLQNTRCSMAPRSCNSLDPCRCTSTSAMVGPRRLLALPSRQPPRRSRIRSSWACSLLRWPEAATSPARAARRHRPGSRRPAPSQWIQARACRHRRPRCRVRPASCRWLCASSLPVPRLCRPLRAAPLQRPAPALPRRRRHATRSGLATERQTVTAERNWREIATDQGQRLLFLRAWSSVRDVRSPDVTGVTHRWIDGGGEGPVPWPDDAGFGPWAARNGLCRVGDHTRPWFTTPPSLATVH